MRKYAKLSANVFNGGNMKKENSDEGLTPEREAILEEMVQRFLKFSPEDQKRILDIITINKRRINGGNKMNKKDYTLDDAIEDVKESLRRKDEYNIPQEDGKLTIFIDGSFFNIQDDEPKTIASLMRGANMVELTKNTLGGYDVHIATRRVT